MSDRHHSTEDIKAQMEAAEMRIRYNLDRLSEDMRELGGKMNRTREIVRWPQVKARELRQIWNRNMTPDVRAVVYPAAALAGAFFFVRFWQRRYQKTRLPYDFST